MPRHRPHTGDSRQSGRWQDNHGYRLHSRRAIGMAIVGVAVVFNVALFVGALIFMASGQSFEQFSGIEQD